MHFDPQELGTTGVVGVYSWWELIWLLLELRNGCHMNQFLFLCHKLQFHLEHFLALSL